MGIAVVADDGPLAGDRSSNLHGAGGGDMRPPEETRLSEKIKSSRFMASAVLSTIMSDVFRNWAIPLGACWAAGRLSLDSRAGLVSLYARVPVYLSICLFVCFPL